MEGNPTDLASGDTSPSRSAAVTPPTDPATPWNDAPGAGATDGDKPVRGADIAELASLAASVSALAELDLLRLGSNGLVDVAAGLECLSRRIDAVKVALAGEIDQRGLGGLSGHAAATGTLLRQLLRITPGEAADRVRLARATGRRTMPSGAVVGPELAGVAGGLAAGRFGIAHAAIIGKMTSGLPAAVTPQTRAYCEDLLVEQAGQVDPAQLSVIARQLAEICDPDGSDPDTAADRMELHIGRRRDNGLTRIWAMLDDVTLANLNVVLTALTSPEQNCADRTGPGGGAAGASPGPSGTDVGAAGGGAADAPQGPSGTDVGAAGGGAPTGDGTGPAAEGPSCDGTGPACDVPRSEGGASPPDPCSGTDEGGPASGTPLADRGSLARRRAHALGEVLRGYLTFGRAPTHGGVRPQLTITIDYQALREGVGSGLDGNGNVLSAAQVRLLACDAVILPAVLGGASEILDVGRSRRTFPPAIRRALALRDGGCAWPGCHRPAALTDAHHIQFWARLGATSLDDGVLLCEPHHREIHRGHWTCRLRADRRPEFIPPAWLDPDQRPRRNTRPDHLTAGPLVRRLT